MKLKSTSLKMLIFLGIFTLFFSLSTYSQEFKSPNEGKSIVYFVRHNANGALINFKIFDGEKYLGKFNGTNYIIYECEPGNHLFWAAAENRSYVEAEIESGKVYLIEVRPTVGAVKSAVRLIPITPDDEKGLKKAKNLIAKKAPYNLEAKDFSGEGEDLNFFISNGMKKYHSDKEKEKSITRLESTSHHN